MHAADTRGEATDWSALFQGSQRQVSALALLHCDGENEAVELLQEVLCHLIERRIRADDPLAYLARALRNAAVTRSRKRALNAKVMDARREILISQQHAEHQADALTHRAAMERLFLAIDTLRDPQRDVLLLKTRGGLSFQQIATTLGIPPNTAASHYRRALTNLRSALSQEDEHDTV